MLVSAEREIAERSIARASRILSVVARQMRRNCRRAGTENRQTLPESPGHWDCHECALIRSRYLPRQLYFGNSLELRTLCVIEHRSAPERGQCDTDHNYKRQVAFHEREKRRISMRQILRQVPALLRFISCASNSLTTTAPREYSPQ